ncbi:hypothetical protein J2755_001454 [Methanohalophilus levihalophilus]|uniref:hypothetical protein n=1 Tax=Methanohalophilus levihalophilus TaxID=1431282 RepID=UPI001AE79362|nr:hypothetical protein [Methanohalophilus levihalophilus]MBP2030520.1 hypothetical protein [Methanohalophilus levihalophilus]
MARNRYILLGLLVCMIFVSGCIGGDEGTTGESTEDVSSESSASDYADEVLAEEGVALTDEEVDSLEQDLAELEAMLEDLENGTDVTVEDF